SGFFKMMVNKGRAGLIFPTAVEFVEQYNRELNIVKAKVISASPLSQDHRDQLTALLEKETDSTILLENEVDADLIGGLVIRVGDRQIDASVLGKLQRLEKHFKEELI